MLKRLMAAVVGIELAGSVDWRSHRENAGGIGVKLKLTATLFALIVTGMAMQAAADPITFDNGTAPTMGPIDVQPSVVDGVQISFSNATYVNYSIPGIIGPNGPPISGNLGIQQYSSVCCSIYPIVITFSDPVSFVSIWAITSGSGSVTTNTNLVD